MKANRRLPFCPKCGADDYRTRKNGTRFCHTCHLLNSKIRYKANPERGYINTLRREYDLSWEQYQQMLTHQQRRCAICGLLPVSPRRLVMDHNHETRRPRALLCVRCNVVVGVAESKLMAQVVKYLAQYKEVSNGA